MGSKAKKQMKSSISNLRQNHVISPPFPTPLASSSSIYHSLTGFYASLFTGLLVPQLRHGFPPQPILTRQLCPCLRRAIEASSRR
ncbi:hypothetical protein SLE2022_380970 [Rubroshorea leprosula]